jgi:hypothetical protein
VILFSVVCAASAGVIQLDDYNFERLTESGDWLVKFYAPW